MPDVGEVAGQAARHQEQRINADRVAIAGESGCKPLGGNSDAAQTIFVECPCGGICRAALFDFDECQRPSAAGDQVDLAA